MLEFLRAVVKARLNVLISGGTGSGKTTLLNVLSSFIPGDERIVTVEDSAELQLRQPHVVRLETRPPNIEGKGAVGQRQLVINTLRMRPDRIIVGEVRGAEAVDMLQASAIQVILHLARLSDGTRKLMTVAEVVGMEGDVVTMQDIFVFERRGVDAEGNVVGRFRPTGIRPRFSDRLEGYGIKLSELLFADAAAEHARGRER